MALACLNTLPAAALAVDSELIAVHPRDANQPLGKRLQTYDQAELLMVLDELAGSAVVDRDARAVSALLRAGQADVVTDHALDALGRLRSREGREVLLYFIHHRRADTRRRAYQALARIADPRDVKVIGAGLRDSSPQVRGSAASVLAEFPSAPGDVGLGSREVRTAIVDDLLLALSLGVYEAAGTIGKLGEADSVPRLTAQVGKLPLSVLLKGYANYLERRDLSDKVKLQIVAVLEDVSGGVVKDFLTAWLAQPEHRAASPELQKAIATAAARVRRLDAAPVTPVRPVMPGVDK